MGTSTTAPALIDGEVVVRLADGWTLRSGVEAPDSADSLTSGDYVRLCTADGTEYAYWHYDEWATDPSLVMGAIINAAAGHRSSTTEDTPRTADVPRIDATIGPAVPAQIIWESPTSGDPIGETDLDDITDWLTGQPLDRVMTIVTDGGNLPNQTPADVAALRRLAGPLDVPYDDRHATVWVSPDAVAQLLRNSGITEHCIECGTPMFYVTDTISHHQDGNAAIDHDRDADHVAVGEWGAP